VNRQLFLVALLLYTIVFWGYVIKWLIMHFTAIAI
jgi:hypothetical protein